jgi:YhcH/YjgK/YiaL family protein
MIVDTIENAEIYYSIHPLFKEAFEYLKSFNYKDYNENSKITLIENKLRAGVDFYKTVPAGSKKWEAHEKYIDIQCVFSGKEKIGYAPRAELKLTDPYNSEKDIMFLEEMPDSAAVFPDLNPGRFAVFFPQDAHKPGIQSESGKELNVVKVVIKIIITGAL